jgi:hypothetical protein
MGFEAQPAAIKAYGDVLETQSTPSTQAYTYAMQNLAVDLGAAQGLLTGYQVPHSQIQSQLENAFSRYALVFSLSEGELDKTADFYEHTDAAQAERLDRTYGGPYHTATLTAGPSPAIHEYNNPAGG